MNFSLFVHMERTDPDTPHVELFHELVDLVLLAEAGGFETVWIGEHHGMEFTIGPNPFDFLSYLAARTERIRLGTATVVAPFWHPLKLAGEAALVDVMSGGRLEFGIARGAYQFEFDRIAGGMKGSEGGHHLREMVPVLQKLWQGDYAHDGEIWRFPVSTSVPKPLQKPYPPMWIAARDPDSHKFAVRSGCNVQVTPLAKSDEEVVSLRDRFEAAVAEYPDVPRPKLMLLRHMHVADNDAHIEKGVRALSEFYKLFDAWFRNDRPIVDGFCTRTLNPAEAAERPDYAPEAIRRNLVIGRPAEVVERIKAYEALGYDQFGYWIDSGLPHEDKRRSLELFIREIMPAFAGREATVVAG
ncbi:MAG: LLM class flavin-dependent oxidoreductase [Chloroflexota bacterium]|nr:LLM class flavin-dependent oxidoreductase [Chloroflexota bacterium]